MHEIIAIGIITILIVIYSLIYRKVLTERHARRSLASSYGFPANPEFSSTQDIFMNIVSGYVDKNGNITGFGLKDETSSQMYNLYNFVPENFDRTRAKSYRFILSLNPSSPLKKITSTPPQPLFTNAISFGNSLFFPVGTPDSTFNNIYQNYNKNNKTVYLFIETPSAGCGDPN
jgi:hypothetical protein